jgi:hypothetical protein
MQKDDLFHQMASILLPKEFLKDFEVSQIKEQPTEWLIELTEKADRVPQELEGKDVVLDGYCGSIDVLTHAFSLKKIFVRFRRRRWKERGQKAHYHNNYDFHMAGAKITPELGAFFKEAFG